MLKDYELFFKDIFYDTEGGIQEKLTAQDCFKFEEFRANSQFAGHSQNSFFNTITKTGMFCNLVETVSDFHNHDPQIAWFNKSFDKPRTLENPIIFQEPQISSIKQCKAIS